jgi:hypothetical protein
VSISAFDGAMKRLSVWPPPQPAQVSQRIRRQGCQRGAQQVVLRLEEAGPREGRPSRSAPALAGPWRPRGTWERTMPAAVQSLDALVNRTRNGLIEVARAAIRFDCFARQRQRRMRADMLEIGGTSKPGIRRIAGRNVVNSANKSRHDNVYRRHRNRAAAPSTPLGDAGHNRLHATILPIARTFAAVTRSSSIEEYAGVRSPDAILLRLRQAAKTAKTPGYSYRMSQNRLGFRAGL